MGAATNARAGAVPHPAGRRRKVISLSPARRSRLLLIRIAPCDVGLFRFVLEAHDNLGLFTVLDSRAALLKLLYSPHQEQEVQETLAEIAQLLPLQISPWPCAMPFDALP